MISTAELISAAKQGAGIPSNYRLARVLDATDSTVQRWNTGRGQPDDAHAAQLARMAGLDVGYVIASMRALREKDDDLRSIWQTMADRLKSAPLAGLAALMLSAGFIGSPAPVEAADGGDSVRYVNKPGRRRKTAMASLVRDLRKSKSH